MDGMVNVIVVGGSRLLREGLQLIISSTKFSADSASGSFADALELLKAGAVRADLIVGDLASNFEEEYQAIATLRHEFPNIKVVVLTRTPTDRVIEHAVQHGVSGLFSSNLSAEVFKHALELVLISGNVGSIAVIYASQNPSDLPEKMGRNGWQIDGASASPGSEAPKLGDAPSEDRADKTACCKPAQLSGREKQILECLVSGMSNKLIARDLNISDATVKVHLRSLRRKLKVQNRTQAAIWSMQNATASARLAIVPTVHPVSERALPRFEARPEMAL